MQAQPETTGAIEVYLAEAGKYLRRRVPASVSESRLAEAREHLKERTEELIAGGMSQEQAQAKAVSVFGSAKEWSRLIAEAAFADPGSVIARRIGTAFGVLAAVCVFGVLVTENFWPDSSAYAAMGCVVVYLLAMVALAVLAFRSRRSATGFLTSIAVVVILGGAFYAGTMFVGNGQGEWPRTKIAPMLQGLPVERAHYQTEAALLSEGTNAYASGVMIPKSLRTANGAYIMPKPLPSPFMLPVPGIDWEAPRQLAKLGYTHFVAPDGPAISAFKVFTPEQRQEFSPVDYYRTLAARLRVADEAPYQTSATRAAAAVEWKKWGPGWLEMIQCASEQDQVEMASYGMDSRGNVGFSWLLARLCAYFMLIVAIPIVLLDLLASYAGRWAFRWHRPKPERTSA